MGEEARNEAPEVGRGRRHPARMVILILLAVVVVAAVLGGFFIANLANSFNSHTQKIAAAFPSEGLRPSEDSSSAENILLLGSDSRGASSSTAEAGGASDQRSDSMMWVHIPADRKNVYVMSIMRDTWVSIPGYGDAKINAAMAYGGVPLLVQTLEGLFGSRVDHVVLADFEGFKSITDAVGGVDVNVPVAFTVEGSGLSFAKGPQTLNGEQALAFVRERYAFVDGDYQRVKDQQIFMKALFSKVLKPSTLANPVTVTQLVDKISPYLTVDKDLTAANVGELLFSLRDVRSHNIKTFTLPSNGTGTSADGQSIVLKDEAAIEAIAAALKSDTVGAYLESAKLG